MQASPACSGKVMTGKSEARGFGRFEGSVHILPIRIYYEDTDLSGVVYHANYLRYMERGRSEFFRCAGIARLAMLDGPEATAWALRKATLEFLKPARADDLIEVHTRATALSGARMSADQNIFHNGELLSRGSVDACIITLSGKPRRIPDEIRRKLMPLLSATSG
jgi:acyl-CoA thioester hydrolase